MKPIAVSTLVVIDGEDYYVTGKVTKATPDEPASFACAGGYPGDPEEIDVLLLTHDDEEVEIPEEGSPEHAAICDALRCAAGEPPDIEEIADTLAEKRYAEFGED